MNNISINKKEATTSNVNKNKHEEQRFDNVKNMMQSKNIQHAQLQYSLWAKTCKNMQKYVINSKTIDNGRYILIIAALTAMKN